MDQILYCLILKPRVLHTIISQPVKIFSDNFLSFRVTLLSFCFLNHLKSHLNNLNYVMQNNIESRFNTVFLNPCYNLWKDAVFVDDYNIIPKIKKWATKTNVILKKTYLLRNPVLYFLYDSMTHFCWKRFCKLWIHNLYIMKSNLIPKDK